MVLAEPLYQRSPCSEGRDTRTSVWQHNCNQLPVEGETGASFTNVHILMPGPAPSNYTDVKNSLGWSGRSTGRGCSYGMINHFDGVDLVWS